MSCWSASLKISKSEVFGLPQLPPILLFLLHICWQLYLVTTHFSAGHSRKQRATLFLQLILPSCLCYILGFITVFSIYPAYNEQNKEGKLLTAIFAPWGCVQNHLQDFRSATEECYPSRTIIRFNCAGVFRLIDLSRVLQADLHGLRSMVTLGIIHGV